jgi:hypothetical protein
MNLKNKLTLPGLLVFILAFFSIAKGNAQGIFPDVPDKIDRKARYMFYLHGRIIEMKGIRPTSEKYGVYEYEKILETLKDKGFIVISEARKPGTIASQYARKVVSQVNRLLQAGVPPSHITVIGASKGALIAMLVSTELRNKEVNFVFLSGCTDAIFHRFDVDFCGNILSIYDEKDRLVGSCETFFKNSTGINKYKEIKLNVGTGHGILYRPLKEWIKPVVKWAKKQK